MEQTEKGERPRTEKEKVLQKYQLLAVCHAGCL